MLKFEPIFGRCGWRVLKGHLLGGFSIFIADFEGLGRGFRGNGGRYGRCGYGGRCGCGGRYGGLCHQFGHRFLLSIKYLSGVGNRGIFSAAKTLPGAVTAFS